MGKLRLLSGKEVRAILARHGFEEKRRRGSHVVMQKAIENSTITVPIPDHREIRLGTLQSIFWGGMDHSMPPFHQPSRTVP